jgi:adenylosuccinate synthase
LNVDKFLKEIEYLKENGFDTSLVKVHPNTHVITDAHIEYDLKHLKLKLGTTGQGIAPCYADKANRVGIQVRRLSFAPLKDFIWDGKLEGKILCEGAQSIWLDINYGDYPFVTSSETFPHNACSLGFSPKKIRDIIGVAKIYDTKSGVDPLFPECLWNDVRLNQLIELGGEFGSTTGRKRIVNWLNFGRLNSAVNLSGATKVIINKCDVFEKVGIFRINNFYETSLETNSFDQLKDIIKKSLVNQNINGLKPNNIIFSGDQTNI